MAPEAEKDSESWVDWIEPDESISALAMVRPPPPMAIRTQGFDGHRFGLALKKHGIKKSHLSVVLNLSHTAPYNWGKKKNGPGPQHFDIVMGIMNGDPIVIEAIKAKIKDFVLSKYNASKDTKMLLDTNFENITGHVRVDKLGNSTQGQDGMVKIPVRRTRDEGGGSMSVTASVRYVTPKTPIDFWEEGEEGEAYGLSISENSMWPFLMVGGIAWVDPARPKIIGKGVVLYKEYVAGGITNDARARILVSYDDDEWTVGVMKPQYHEVKISRKEFPICHCIVGTDHIGD